MSEQRIRRDIPILPRVVTECGVDCGCRPGSCAMTEGLPEQLEPHWVPCPSCGRQMLSSAKTCGNYCRLDDLVGNHS